MRSKYNAKARARTKPQAATTLGASQPIGKAALAYPSLVSMPTIHPGPPLTKNEIQGGLSGGARAVKDPSVPLRPQRSQH
jgi:hypothetical protein